MVNTAIVFENVEECLTSCIHYLRRDHHYAELAVVRLESTLSLLDTVPLNERPSSFQNIKRLVEEAALHLINIADTGTRPVGRPRTEISISSVEYLLSLNFKVPLIAKMLGVSRRTVFNRLKENGISVSQTYTSITDDALDDRILNVLMTHPNTGYKRMKEFLALQDIKVTDQRVRERMRVVDPSGVNQRTKENRAILRRQYFVMYSNHIWHIDTNLKLIRWKIVVRVGVDGKSRTGIYLESGDDNTAESGFLSFLKGVSEYGVPCRTRSDKGGENVLVARYMLETRGLNRGSHICGRSVHNQRIERFWRDVFYGCLSFYYYVFSALEEDGILDIDNTKHLYVLHYVFLPRLNLHLKLFREAWNLHPISTEHNYTPAQLMLMHLPPPEADLALTSDDVDDLYFLCNNVSDTTFLLNDGEDALTYPIPPTADGISEGVLRNLSSIDVYRDSSSFGYDIFTETVQMLGAAS